MLIVCSRRRIVRSVAPALWLLVLFALGACGDDDGTRADAGDGAPPLDADTGLAADSGPDAGDAGCDPPEAPPWDPPSSGGPEGETEAQCLARVGEGPDNTMPGDQRYVLEVSSARSDGHTTMCGSVADGLGWTVANEQRFNCGMHVRLSNAAHDRCVIVEVSDRGPGICTDEAAGGPVWDVSPAVAEHLAGSRDVTYSEGVAVYGAPVDSGNELGPCDHLDSPARILAGFIGGACATDGDCHFDGARCDADWPGGHCTMPCMASCPDAVGPVAFTVCQGLDSGESVCVARCDYSLFSTGCRPGYGCTDTTHPVSGAPQRVCLPLEC